MPDVGIVGTHRCVFFYEQSVYLNAVAFPVRRAKIAINSLSAALNGAQLRITRAV